jgi:hypothetical protein
MHQHTSCTTEGLTTYSSSKPKVLKMLVQGSIAEDTLGTNETPDDRGVEEDSTSGTGEVVRLSRGAYVFDVVESPFDSRELYQG